MYPNSGYIKHILKLYVFLQYFDYHFLLFVLRYCYFYCLFVIFGLLHFVPAILRTFGNRPAHFICMSFALTATRYTDCSASLSQSFVHSAIDLLIPFACLFASCPFSPQGQAWFCASTTMLDFSSLYRSHLYTRRRNTLNE